MYHGNSSASNGQSTTNVWDSNYKMVQHLNETPSGTGGIHEDSSANNNDGTTRDGVNTDVDGKIGGADQFDGNDDEISISVTVSSTYTLEMWIYTETLDGKWGTLFAGSNAVGIWYQESKDKISYYYSGTDHFSDSVVPHNSWQQISVVNNAGSATFYLNGASDGTASNAPGFTAKYIGNDNYDEPFKGRIDEIRVSNTARSAAWIKASFHSSNGSLMEFGEIENIVDVASLEQDTIGLWYLNENSGTVARDSSDHNNDGSITGASWVPGIEGSALSFDGEDDVVIIDHADSLNATDNITIEAWFNASETDVTVGEITNSDVDYWEHQSKGGNPSRIYHHSDNIFIIVLTDDKNDGWIKTVTITDDGIISDSAIDSLEFEKKDGKQPDLVQVSDTMYAVAYQGSKSDGFLKTIEISSDGTISNTVTDTFEFDKDTCIEPDILQVDTDTFAIAYEGSNGDGHVITVDISSNGQITNHVTDSLEFDTSAGSEPSIVHVSDDIFAISYQGSGSDGFVKTIEIQTNGSITNSVIDSFEFNSDLCENPEIEHISGNVFAIAYQGDSSPVWYGGILTTIEIDTDGMITNSVLDEFAFNVDGGNYPDIIYIGADVYGIAYTGPDDDGFMTTVTISSQGTIGSEIDTFEFDQTNGIKPTILKVSDDIYALSYTGAPDSKGVLKTINVISDLGVYKGNAFGFYSDSLHIYGRINEETISADNSAGWSHIVLTYDMNALSNQIKLYLDGSIVANGSLTEQINTNFNNLIIGGSFSGTIDHLAIYDRALTPEEILYKFENVGNVPVDTSSSLVINEIMYNPNGSDAGNEWVEIYNPSNETINLDGYFLSNHNLTHRIALPNWNMIADSYLVIHTGTGTNDANFSDNDGNGYNEAHYYAGLSQEFLDNDQDEVALYILSCGMGNDDDEDDDDDDDESNAVIADSFESGDWYGGEPWSRFWHFEGFESGDWSGGPWSAGPGWSNQDSDSKSYEGNRHAHASGKHTDKSLTMTSSLDLSGYENIELTFYHYFYQTESVDSMHVDVSANGGSTWSNLESWDGDDPTLLDNSDDGTESYVSEKLNLSAYDGETDLRIRFRHTISTTGEGWRIDNIALTGDSLSGAGSCGWNDAWIHDDDNGDAQVLDEFGGDSFSGAPHNGDHFLEMGDGTNWVSRQFSMEELQGGVLSLWWKAMGFEELENAYIKISSDGENWTTILTVNESADEEDDDDDEESIIYALRGDDKDDFWKYSPSSDTWTNMENTPEKVKFGASLAYTGDGHMFAFRGNDKTDFWRYDISSDSWSSMEDAPDKVKEGGSLVYGGGNYLYAFRGHDKDDFWRYDISSDSWSSMEKAPDKVKEGGALVYSGGNYLYGFRGHDKDDFWRYDISDDSWSSMEKAPDKVKEGGALVYDGGNYLYALRGHDKEDFWRYDISDDSWSSMEDAPEKVKHGGSLAYADGTIFAFRGHHKDFWQYDVSSDSWSILEDAPENVKEGGSLAMVSEGEGGNDEDEGYTQITYDLSSYAGDDTVWLGFNMDLNSDSDRFLIDDIEIHCTENYTMVDFVNWMVPTMNETIGNALDHGTGDLDGNKDYVQEEYTFSKDGNITAFQIFIPDIQQQTSNIKITFKIFDKDGDSFTKDEESKGFDIDEEDYGTIITLTPATPISVEAGQYLGFKSSKAIKDAVGGTGTYYRLHGDHHHIEDGYLPLAAIYGSGDEYDSGISDSYSAYWHAVDQGIWTEGDYFDSTNVSENETIGRDMFSTDTDSSDDWAGTGGKDVYYATEGFVNYDIPEFSDIMLPLLFVIGIVFYFRKKHHITGNKHKTTTPHTSGILNNNYEDSETSSFTITHSGENLHSH